MASERGRKARPAVTSARRVSQAEAALERPQRPASRYPVRWVRCEDCGGGRHVDARGRHGAMPVRGVTLTVWAGDWPTCGHGAPCWENCRGRPVEPPCCRGMP